MQTLLQSKRIPMKKRPSMALEEVLQMAPDSFEPKTIYLEAIAKLCDKKQELTEHIADLECAIHALSTLVDGATDHHSDANCRRLGSLFHAKFQKNKRD